MNFLVSSLIHTYSRGYSETLLLASDHVPCWVNNIVVYIVCFLSNKESFSVCHALCMQMIGNQEFFCSCSLFVDSSWPDKLLPYACFPITLSIALTSKKNEESCSCKLA